MKILALIVDFKSTLEATRLSKQIAESTGAHSVKIVHIDNGNIPAVPVPGVLRLAQNEGYAGGILGALAALGVQADDYDAYWFLNSDLEVDPDCLSQLASRLRENDRLGAVGPRIFAGHSTRIWGARGVVNPVTGMTAMTDWTTPVALPKWSYLPGCSVLVRAKAYAEVGGLSPRYRMYYEETELCIKLQKHGWQLAVEPSARAFHHVNSIRDRLPAKHLAFYFARNNLYFWKSCFGIPAWVQFPRTLFVVFKELLFPLRRARTAGDFFAGAGYALAGVWDGFEFLRRSDSRPKTRFEKKLFFGDS